MHGTRDSIRHSSRRLGMRLAVLRLMGLETIKTGLQAIRLRYQSPTSVTHSLLHEDMRRRIESTIEQFAAHHGIVKEKAILIARRGIDRLRNEHLQF